ncbi:MAG: AIPR family protein [Clostridiales bacterium]|nr:AIPR family protein [Clostridiales bacterium]MCF8021756.1 AIPR family protein [Clostridiales bacterium]
MTDGNNDKKCDLVYVDSEKGVAIVAQGYFTEKEKKSAPANKASDLNTAAAWLLSRNSDELPENLTPAAVELREALRQGDIRTLEFWYVHNLPESSNVRNELASVEETVKISIKDKYDDSNCDEIRAIEIGMETLEEWYEAIKTPILVRDEFIIEVPGGYELERDQWKAFSTAVSAMWIYEIFNKYGKSIFSANVRDYLGSRRSDANINHGIKQSTIQHPDKFWAFNNGITALVNDFEIIDKENKKQIKINGISIVNGAQTTGAIGTLDSIPNENAMVQTRFIKCTSPEIVQEIVRYNNSQNKMKAADFRSTDGVQNRLRREFTQYHPNVTYLGTRRGGAENAISRPSNLIPSDTVAQSLAAFHQIPGIAYNQKSNIWESDSLYSKLFNESTHASHLLFVYSLNQAITNIKNSLMIKEKKENSLTTGEKEILSFLRFRGSIYILMVAIGNCMETILYKNITNKFLLRFNEQKELAEYEKLWESIVQCCIPFKYELKRPLDKGLKNQGDIQESLVRFKSFVEATYLSNKETYSEFSSKVITEPWLVDSET